MKYRNYTIERTYYGKPAYKFQHNDFDGAPESYFSEHEQEPTSDTRNGLSNSIEDAKEQIDEMEQDRLYALNIEWSFKFDEPVFDIEIDK